MIYINRPAAETHKTVEKLDRKSLDSNMRRRKPVDPEFEKANGNKDERFYEREELEKAVEDTNRIVFKDDNRFEFRIHDRTGRILVKLIDNKTEEVVKEIPPEKILDLVASIWDLVGILVDERG